MVLHPPHHSYRLTPPPVSPSLLLLFPPYGDAHTHIRSPAPAPGPRLACLSYYGHGSGTSADRCDSVMWLLPLPAVTYIRFYVLESGTDTDNGRTGAPLLGAGARIRCIPANGWTLRQDSRRAWGTMNRTLQRQVQRLLDNYPAFHSRLYSIF